MNWWLIFAVGMTAFAYEFWINVIAEMIEDYRESHDDDPEWDDDGYIW